MYSLPEAVKVSPRVSGGLCNFICMTLTADVKPVMRQLREHYALWDKHRLRTTFPGSPHKGAQDIWLRFNPLKPLNLRNVMDSLESVDYPAYSVLTEARKLVDQIAEGNAVGRVLITKLRPGEMITPHIDEGQYAAAHDRYHVVLQGGFGNRFTCGNESVDMLTGEVWWFDTSKVHSVRNDSSMSRIHLIVDLMKAGKGKTVLTPANLQVMKGGDPNE